MRGRGILVWLAALTPAAGVLAGEPAALRDYVEPVCFTTAPSEVPAQVAAAKPVLDRFARAGFGAVWQVNDLPGNGLEEWVTNCLAAFPAPPVVALDASLKAGALWPSLEDWDRFLALALPHAGAVMINYTNLDNLACAGREEIAFTACRKLSGLVRRRRPEVLRWVLLEDDPAGAASMRTWVQALADGADGFLLRYPHGMNVQRDPVLRTEAEPLLATGKPVLLGGFVYTAPRPRPPLARALAAQYVERLERYESWLRLAGYAGYVRSLGGGIPLGVKSNWDYLPPAGERRGDERMR